MPRCYQGQAAYGTIPAHDFGHARQCLEREGSARNTALGKYSQPRCFVKKNSMLAYFGHFWSISGEIRLSPCRAPGVSATAC